MLTEGKASKERIKVPNYVMGNSIYYKVCIKNIGGLKGSNNLQGFFSGEEQLSKIYFK